MSDANTDDRVTNALREKASNELSLILGEIEERAKEKTRVQPPGRICDCTNCISEREKIALVKALRRAIQALEILNDGSFPILRSDISIGIELRELTAILRQ